MKKLKSLLEAKGIVLFALIDRSGKAKKVGLSLNFEQLLVFGDPKVGTLLMQENPAIGIELPLKILIWQDGEGNTQIAYKRAAATFKYIRDKEKCLGLSRKWRKSL